jgi:hypothetical protein
MIRSSCVALLFATACHISTYPAPPPAPPAEERAAPLGAQRMIGYHVSANAPSRIQAGESFEITADGKNGYKLVYTDTAGSPSQFYAVISTDVGFDKVSPVSGTESVKLNGKQIMVSSVPGAAKHGVSFVARSEPIYLTAYIDGRVQGNIYFTGGLSGALATSPTNPVAFTSP